MAQEPEVRPGADDASGLRVWKWGFGIATVHNVACLSGATLYLRPNLLTFWGKNRIVRALQDGVPPQTAIPRKRVEIPLESVLELRHSEEAGVLEIDYGAKAPAVVFSPGAPVHREIYEALRERIAPGVAPSAGTISAVNAIYTPAIGLFLAILLGAIAVKLSTEGAFDPRHFDPQRFDPRHVGPGVGPKKWLRDFLAGIGTPNVVAIAVAVVACFAGWMVYRILHPHRAEVIVPARPPG